MGTQAHIKTNLTHLHEEERAGGLEEAVLGGRKLLQRSTCVMTFLLTVQLSCAESLISYNKGIAWRLHGQKSLMSVAAVAIYFAR